MNPFLKRLSALANFALALILLSGCEHKELCYDHGHNVEIDIRFIWDAAPDADPNTMVVNFFTPDGKHFTTREFTSRDGGRMRIEAGEYMILFHNGEMESVKEALDVFDRYALTTNEESLLSPMSRDLGAPPRPTISANEPVRSTAETVWAGQCTHVMFERNKQGQFVELHPAEATARYTVEVVNVENLRDNIDISAALSGLSERLNVSSSSASGQPVTVPFSIERKDDKTLEAKFVTFGHCPENKSVSHIVSIYTSSKVYYNFDVTDQVHNAEDDKNIYIRINGLKLPTDGQGVTPSIDGWEDVEDVIINMN